jgi:hypothetical protein
VLLCPLVLLISFEFSPVDLIVLFSSHIPTDLRPCSSFSFLPLS